jgi:pyruvate kinase
MLIFNLKEQLIMKDKQNNEMSKLYQDLVKLKKSILDYELKHKKELNLIHPEFKTSSRNFLHYLALRKTDLKNMQLSLANLGLSSLGRSESHVLSNIEEVMKRLESSLNDQGKKNNLSNDSVNHPTWPDSEKILHKHTEDLFGKKPKLRHEYIMVTVPEIKLVTEEWIQALLVAGTNLFRVNCAHETINEWTISINLIKRVALKNKTLIRIMMDLGGPKVRVILPKKIKIATQGTFHITSKDIHHVDGKNLIQIGPPEILDHVNVGDRVLFDDGKFEAVILSTTHQKCLIQFVRVPADKKSLKQGKGINFPDTYLPLKEFTTEDKKNLKQIANLADIVALSFVQNPETVKIVRREIKKYSKKELGLVLKIETKAGFKALPKLILEGMKHYPLGVMVARGDLAVEVGFQRLVEVQEEILWFSEAAHIPAIWATQVLEGHAKMGLASRAEVTDAAHAVRAECIMLNKGPFIHETVKLLDNILVRMEKHFYKKRNLYRQLDVASLK